LVAVLFGPSTFYWVSFAVNVKGRPKPKNPNRPVAVELFAGAGGLSLGFEQAGFDLAAAVEIDPVHCAIHELNFPQTKVICANIANLTGDDIRRAAHLEGVQIDTVFGGPPCQGFSLIGQRVLDDPRNELVFHFLRIVTELRPRTFVLENVPGMASGKQHDLLDQLIARFEAAGYRVRQPYQILNAAHFGVPQNRRRLFLLGALEGVPLPEYPEAQTVLPEKKNALGTHLFADEKSVAPTVNAALSDLPDLEQFDDLFETDELEIRLIGGSDYARVLRGELCDPTDFSWPRSFESDRLTGCGRAEHTALSKQRFAATAPGSVEPISRFLKLNPDGLCNTLRAGTNTDRGAFSAPRPIHPVSPRCITVREAARLHSFPDWFRFHRTIWHGFREIGNSVPPRLARAVAAQVLTGLGHTPVKPSEPLELGNNNLASLTMREAANYFGVNSNVIAPRKRTLVAAD
jgi:DNA (cytosine-5)-methyltransferase 1